LGSHQIVDRLLRLIQGQVGQAAVLISLDLLFIQVKRLVKSIESSLIILALLVIGLAHQRPGQAVLLFIAEID
jgi:hypothetical protein